MEIISTLNEWIPFQNLAVKYACSVTINSRLFPFLFQTVSSIYFHSEWIEEEKNNISTPTINIGQHVHLDKSLVSLWTAIPTPTNSNAAISCITIPSFTSKDFQFCHHIKSLCYTHLVQPSKYRSRTDHQSHLVFLLSRAGRSWSRIWLYTHTNRKHTNSKSE